VPVHEDQERLDASKAAVKLFYGLVLVQHFGQVREQQRQLPDPCQVHKRRVGSVGRCEQHPRHQSARADAAVID